MLQDENNNNTTNRRYNYKNGHLNNNLSKDKVLNENINNNRNFGKLVNNKGEIYVGPVKNRLPDGEGKLYNKNGELTYEGYFVKGIQEGKGRKITKNEYYNGNFIEAKCMVKEKYILRMVI